jgi:hypothetical protein
MHKMQRDVWELRSAGRSLRTPAVGRQCSAGHNLIFVCVPGPRSQAFVARCAPDPAAWGGDGRRRWAAVGGGRAGPG